MNLHKVITRIAAALQDVGELRRVARALGNELPRHRLDVLRSFRAEMASFSLPEGSFAAGYIAAMVDVTAEYETCVRQSEDMEALEQLAVGEGAREVLLALAPGARLPSEIATLVGKDRSTIAHALRRLRAAGLVEAPSSDRLDGRTRPHRLTPMGRRVAAQPLAQDAVSQSGLLRPEPPVLAAHNHELSRPAIMIPQPGDSVPQSITGELSARLAEGTAPHPFLGAAAQPALEGRPESRGAGIVGTRNDELWRNIPGLISQLEAHKNGDMPVFVRTSDVGWGAWAYALHQSDRTGKSRTIVNGDILSHALEPPHSRFALVYDDPAVISADAQQPTMRAFMERADEKFVVTSASDDVPEGFIRLTMAPGRSAG